MHWRALLKFTGQTGGWVYKVIACLNIFTIIVFRICAASYLAVYPLNHFDQLGLAWSIICGGSAALLVIMNCTLLYRVVQTDFVRPRRVKSNEA